MHIGCFERCRRADVRKCQITWYRAYHHLSVAFFGKVYWQLLTLQGEDSLASWTLTKVGMEEERMGVDREIKILEEWLAEVEGWEKRVKELDQLLGVQKNTVTEVTSLC